MLSILQQFRENIKRVQALGRLYDVLSQQTTSALDLADLLRSQIVMAVSAFDHYVHEITRVGMLEVYGGKRPQTPAFLRFQVTMEATLQGIAVGQANDGWLDEEIRRKHGYLAFQHPDKIADAIRLFSSCRLWPSVASELNLEVEEVRTELQLIIDRRNQIAHEADLDSRKPGSRWAISAADTNRTINFIQKIGEAIYIIVN
jgi:hypothetical protein